MWGLARTVSPDRGPRWRRGHVLGLLHHVAPVGGEAVLVLLCGNDAVTGGPQGVSGGDCPPGAGTYWRWNSSRSSMSGRSAWRTYASPRQGNGRVESCSGGQRLAVRPSEGRRHRGPAGRCALNRRPSALYRWRGCKTRGSPTGRARPRRRGRFAAKAESSAAGWTRRRRGTQPRRRSSPVIAKSYPAGSGPGATRSPRSSRTCSAVPLWRAPWRASRAAGPGCSPGTASNVLVAVAGEGAVGEDGADSGVKKRRSDFGALLLAAGDDGAKVLLEGGATDEEACTCITREGAQSGPWSHAEAAWLGGLLSHRQCPAG